MAVLLARHCRYCRHRCRIHCRYWRYPRTDAGFSVGAYTSTRVRRDDAGPEPATGLEAGHELAREVRPLSMPSAPFETQLLRGAPVAAALRERTLASSTLLREQLGVTPTLVTLHVGADPAALAYRGSIERSVAKAGIEHRGITLPPSVGTDEFIDTIFRLNDDPLVHGVLVLMPMPPHLNLELAAEHLSPMKDVDGITPTNAGRLHLGLPALRPSTPQGGIELLDHYGIDLEGKHAVVIGRSNIVGKPMATLMTRRNATVTLCHRKTVDLAHHVAQAEIVAVAAGSPGLIRGDMLREGAVVIDFGINVLGDGIVGDVDAASVMGVASGYTPVPGGTGPVTVMVLASNTIAAAFASMATPFEAAGDPIGASSLTR